MDSYLEFGRFLVGFHLSDWTFGILIKDWASRVSCLDGNAKSGVKLGPIEILYLHK